MSAALAPFASAYIPGNAIAGLMASITIRNLEEPLKAKLRIQAATTGKSMKKEARDILRNALNRHDERPANLVTAIRARFAPLLIARPRPPMRGLLPFVALPGGRSANLTLKSRPSPPHGMRSWQRAICMTSMVVACE